MTPTNQTSIPPNYGERIRQVREIAGLTQAQLAELIGVSYTSVNRWENNQSRPNKLAWQKFAEMELLPTHRELPATPANAIDFSASPQVVSTLAEAYRLSDGHLFNPAFASETSLIDPLPHQRLAVYERMLHQTPLRLLLADDAGAGKTIMTGLYIREMMARRLIRRVLIIPPAGLTANWQREMRTLFRLHFQVITGSDARQHDNPFTRTESDLAIISIDTLTRQRVFDQLRDNSTIPYDLVVFDEAHKLSADRQPDLRIRKTDRYRLAEAIAGAADSSRWNLPWSAQHLLLLTATPHMGKDFPYYMLWRLLLPHIVPTFEAFEKFPAEARRRHFVRRTKEEMVHFDASPIYPARQCDTLSYELAQGTGSEQELYEATTTYIDESYNQAVILNRSAARLAMSVFQRRMASSTYALMRSFEKRMLKLDDIIARLQEGKLTQEELARQQDEMEGIEDTLETTTADEQPESEESGEGFDAFEDQALGAVVNRSLAGLSAERCKVEGLLAKARAVYEGRQESKFAKLREILDDPAYTQEKFIIFTEYRDTADFLVRRLEALGYTGRIAAINGGTPLPERERQVQFFRQPDAEQGARFLVATDAAGEGINLQFCWIMVNYDIPWNPARLEQRMGRIHRYGQKHDPVVIVNLVAGATREGVVLKTLLDKLETIRRQLNSNKVFDVIGRLFDGVSIKDYIEQALADGDETRAVAQIEGKLTAEQVKAIEEREAALYGQGGDVVGELDRLNRELAQENYRHLIPGYVARFIEKAAPLLDLKIEGDAHSTFRLVPTEARALDPLYTALESYGESSERRLTVHRPALDAELTWLHPGEEVFDRLAAALTEKFGNRVINGAVFSDPYADEPYLFHLAMTSVLAETPETRPGNARLLESHLVGLRQKSDGSVEQAPLEHLLMLKGVENFAPGAEPLALAAQRLAAEAREYAASVVASNAAQKHRQQIMESLPERVEFVGRGFDYQRAELAATRTRLTVRSQEGDHRAAEELAQVKTRQRNLEKARASRLDEMRAEPHNILPGEPEFLVHALVVPSRNPEDAEQYDADVEAIAMQVAMAYERDFNAEVADISHPELARRAGLTDWPGFDLLSLRPPKGDGSREELAIEVKGRRGHGSIEMKDNEWANACNLRGKYWLYVVFDCATPHPRLVRVCDPFGKLLAKTRESMAFTITESQILEAAE